MVGETVTTERAAGLERMRAYVATLQPLLLLAHWHLSVEEAEPVNDNASASVRYNESDWRALLYFSDWCLAADAETQRLHVAHELIHLHLRGVDRAHGDSAHLHSSQTWALLDARMHHETELAVDSLAMAVAPLLPLPTSEATPSEAIPAPPQPFLCGIVSMAGPQGEPLACAYPPGHEGDHSWATLPIFNTVNVERGGVLGQVIEVEWPDRAEQEKADAG